MEYSIDGEVFTEGVPVDAVAGDYTVWYMVTGDENHNDTEPRRVTSDIAKAAPAVTAPKATNPSHNGKAQPLVTAGTAKGGTMQYSLDGKSYSDKIPTGNDAKAYTVWYKVAGDENHFDSEPDKVISTITEKPAPAGELTPALSGHVQNVGDVAGESSGRGARVGTEGRSLRLESFSLALPKDVEGGIEYRGHVQNVGWAASGSGLEFGTTGQSRRLEAVRLGIGSQPVAGGIEYEVHAQNRGWMPAAADGATAGTTGESRRLEAVRVRLTGEAAQEGNFSVWYRVHSQNQGWLGWAHDGEDAGTTGMGLRAEAIDVQVLPQGQVPRGYDGSPACVAR